MQKIHKNHGRFNTSKIIKTWFHVKSKLDKLWNLHTCYFQLLLKVGNTEQCNSSLQFHKSYFIMHNAIIIRNEAKTEAVSWQKPNTQPPFFHFWVQMALADFLIIQLLFVNWLSFDEKYWFHSLFGELTKNCHDLRNFCFIIDIYFWYGTFRMHLFS